MTKPAVVLLSGGLDSSTVVAVAQERGFEVNALSFNYGQRHVLELEAAKRVGQAAGVVRHEVRDIALFGGSALTDDDIAVPKGRNVAAMGDGVPVTYVPCRNTIFLSYALSWAEVLASEDIFVGVNALDYSGYPDCRPAYIEAYERMANLASAAAVEGRQRLTVHAPLINMTKARIVAEGIRLSVDYSITTSCYDPNAEGACGDCDACSLRRKGFAEAGAVDPAPYRSR